jgi:hypothetical protein
MMMANSAAVGSSLLGVFIFPPLLTDLNSVVSLKTT